jgi:hypothetical protein
LFNGKLVDPGSINYVLEWTNNSPQTNFVYYSPNTSLNLTNYDNPQLSSCSYTSSIPDNEQPLVIDSDNSYTLNLNGRCPENTTSDTNHRVRMELTPKSNAVVKYTAFDGYTYTGSFEMTFDNNIIPTEKGSWPGFSDLAKSKNNNHASITFLQIFGAGDINGNGGGNPVIEFCIGFWGSNSAESWKTTTSVGTNNYGPAIGAFVQNPNSDNNVSKYTILSTINNNLIKGGQFGFNIVFTSDSLKYTISGDVSGTNEINWEDINPTDYVYLKQGAYSQVNHTGNVIDIPDNLSWSDTKICSLKVLESKLSQS